MLWFVTAWNTPDGPRERTTRKESEQQLAAAFAEHCAKLAGAEPSGLPPTRLPRTTSAAKAEETSYRTRDGFLHGVLVLHTAAASDDMRADWSATQAIEMLQRRFPQWTRHHEEDERRGIVRSDAPKVG